jgi:hypothetical protein
MSRAIRISAEIGVTILVIQCVHKRMVRFQKLTVSKVNKKSISHLTRIKRTRSAAATVQVSHALPAVCFSCLLRGQFPRWRRSRKSLCVLRFEVSRSVITVKHEFRAQFRTAGSAYIYLWRQRVNTYHAALCRGLETLLSELRGRGIAWERHGMCELALRGTRCRFQRLAVW